MTGRRKRGHRLRCCRSCCCCWKRWWWWWWRRYLHLRRRSLRHELVGEVSRLMACSEVGAGMRERQKRCCLVGCLNAWLPAIGRWTERMRTDRGFYAKAAKYKEAKVGLSGAHVRQLTPARRQRRRYFDAAGMFWIHSKPSMGQTYPKAFEANLCRTQGDANAPLSRWQTERSALLKMQRWQAQMLQQILNGYFIAFSSSFFFPP
jgi:hypothetical protein